MPVCPEKLDSHRLENVLVEVLVYLYQQVEH